MNASYERPHRLALLATSPVATGEAKQEEPRKGTETQPVLTKTDSGLYFKTISPQGDGNPSSHKTCQTFSVHFKTISPQGDGNFQADVIFIRACQLFQNHIPARGRSVSPASPARAGEGDRVSGGGGAMDASRKPSIATEVHASHERPHRLALLATSPVATGEAKQEEPRKGTETPLIS